MTTFPGENYLPVELEQPVIVSLPSVSERDDIVDSEVTLRERFRRVCIGAHLVIDAAFHELDEGLETAASWKQRTALKINAAGAVGGQVYERARMPEILGVSGTTWAYKEALLQGTNSAVATAVGATALGVFVYTQQKIIGKNFVQTGVNFPKTYETVNQMWPKTVEAIQDAIPSANNRIGEGLGMVSLGTTPFIASAKSANPDISKEELSTIERRVTRRGSIAAGSFAGIVLGAKSLAVHLPARAGVEAVKWSDKAIDVVSNPYILGGSFAGWAVLKAGARAVLKRR